jgi:hypothetical protein
MYYEWTKRLGQKHWIKNGEDETLCGMPALGNNYAESIAEADKVPCEDCIVRRNHGDKV